MSTVNIIIVNYNTKEFIKDCIKALDKQSFKDFEIITVDNNSSDDSLSVIQNLLMQSSVKIKLIPLNRNTGFTGGNNEGFKHINSKYIALLNPDVIVCETWLEELVKAMDFYPEVGIYASKLIVHKTNVIDSAGDGYATSLRGFKRGEEEKKEKYSQQEYVFGACAGAALYRREMLEEIGFFDEDFFLIHEDTDLNFRAQLAGWKVMHVPTAIIYHKVRSTIGHMSDMAIYYTLRNSEFVRIKNIPLPLFFRCLPEFILGTISEFIYFAIKHRRFSLYFTAKMDVLRMLPKMLKKRAKIMKNKKASNRYLYSIMTPVLQKDFLMSKIKKLLYG